MIKDALTHAANFANEADKTSAGHSFVVISDRTFSVSNGTSGAIVSGAPDGVTATVALKQLRKTIAKSGDSPALSVGKGKLTVKAGRSKVSLPMTSRPGAIETDWPDSSAKRQPLPANVVSAIQSAATIQKTEGSALDGIRLAPEIVAVCTQTSIVAVQTDAFDWADPATIHPKVFARGLSGDYSVFKSGRRLWFEAPGDHAVWTLPLAGSYPDALVRSKLLTEFDTEESITFAVDVDEILASIAKASVLLDGDESAVIGVRDGALVIEGKFLRGEFSDSIEIEGANAGASARCGVYLLAFEAWLKSCRGASAALSGETKATISLEPPIDAWESSCQSSPIMLESGSIRAILSTCIV